MRIKNRLFYKGTFWLLVLAGTALIGVSIGLPVFLPIGIPVGCVCLSGAFAMFQSRFTGQTPTAEAQAEAHAETNSVASEPMVLEENVTMNFYFGNQRPVTESVNVPRGTNRLTLA